MLALAVALALSSNDVDWCDADCFVRAHPAAARAGLVTRYGGVDLVYAFRLMLLENRPEAAVERISLSWAMPLSEVLEVDAGFSVTTQGYPQLLPGARYSIVKFGESIVLAVSGTVAMGWRQGWLELRAWPSIEVHVGPSALQVIVDTDLTGRGGAGLWCGIVLGL